MQGKYAASQGLGGIMFWSLDSDDFSGVCNTGKYPLINQGIAGFGIEPKPKNRTKVCPNGSYGVNSGKLFIFTLFILCGVNIVFH